MITIFINKLSSVQPDFSTQHTARVKPSQYIAQHLYEQKRKSNCSSKCFTCVTKTIANLTTYSRKPGDYNGTIIFEIDIMKNSSPFNLEVTFFATVKTKITLLFCWTHSTLSSASKCDRVNQNKRNNQKFCEKVKFDMEFLSLITSIKVG